MLVKAGISFSKASIVLAGNASKAASVGANTVKGPSPPKVPAKSAAITAASRYCDLAY